MKRARPKGKQSAKKIKNDTGYSKNISSYESVVSEIQAEKGGIKSSKKSGKKANKKKRNFKKISLIAICVLAFVFVIFMGINHFDDADLLAPLENGKINVLMLGVDESGLRTDAIMLASYDANEGSVNLLSIPRDTKIKIENKRMTKKINGIHALPGGKNGEILGVEATAEAVTALTGLPVNYYVEFSFLSIDHLFDILGPVRFDVPDVEGKGRGMNYDDPYQNLHIHLKPGLQELSGNQVQQFLRYRKSNYHVGTGSDTDRVKRQQEFIKAVIDQKVNIGIISKLPSIFSQLTKEIKTNISPSDILSYIRYVSKIKSDNLHSYSLPGEAKTIGGASYYVCNLNETQKLVSDVFGSTGVVTDKINITGEYSQKPLQAGNMTKPDATQNMQTEEQNRVPDKPVKSENEINQTENEPDTEEETEEEEEEENTLPEPEQNSTPLEEIYNLDD